LQLWSDPQDHGGEGPQSGFALPPLDLFLIFNPLQRLEVDLSTHAQIGLFSDFSRIFSRRDLRRKALEASDYSEFQSLIRAAGERSVS
jgi:hypothetical protein